MEKIIVPFLKKEEAITLGAKFDRTSREWLIPDDLEEEKKNKLRNIGQEEIPEEIPYDSSGHTYMRQQYYDWDGSPSSEKEDDIEKDEQNQEDFTDELYVKYDVPDGLSTLGAAMLIFEHGGMPETEEKRIKLLKGLGNRDRHEYPIEYDGMLNCPGFKEAYPEDLISNMVSGKITGRKKLYDEIEDLDVSKEYKMLLHFVLPFSVE